MEMCLEIIIFYCISLSISYGRIRTYKLLKHVKAQRQNIPNIFKSQEVRTTSFSPEEIVGYK